MKLLQTRSVSSFYLVFLDGVLDLVRRVPEGGEEDLATAGEDEAAAAAGAFLAAGDLARLGEAGGLAAAALALGAAGGGAR